MHGAKFQDLELFVLKAGPPLDMEKWTGRLQALTDEDKQRQSGKHENHDWDRDCHINCSFQEPVERIFQRLFPQSNEAKSAVLKMRDRMTKFLFQIAQDQQTNTELVAGMDHVLVRVHKQWKLQKDHLGDSLFPNHLLDLVRFAEDGNSIAGAGDILVANQANRPKPDLGLPVQPFAKLLGFAAGTDQQGLVFGAENSSGENRRKVKMRKQQRDIQPRDEVEEEHT